MTATHKDNNPECSTDTQLKFHIKLTTQQVLNVLLHCNMDGDHFQQQRCLLASTSITNLTKEKNVLCATRKKGSQARGRTQRLHLFVRNVFCVLAIAFEVSHTCSKCCYSYCRKPLTYWCEVIGFGQCYLACKCWYYWIERTETKFAHVLKLFNVLCDEGLLTKVTQR